MSKKAKDSAAASPSGGEAKKGKGKKGKGEPEAGNELAIRVGAHPRARRSIRRVRAQAGIAGFVVTLLLAQQAGVPAFETLLRALAGGVVAHFVTWAFAIALWRRLIVAELEAARAEVLRRRAARTAAAPAGAVPAAARRAAGTAPATTLPGA